MNPIFFENAEDFRKWLKSNHNKSKELTVGYYKVSTGKPSMNWSESVDQALCFGWIDGIRRSIDEESYCIRFTPRNPNSKWSAVNITKVETLIANGQMTPSGMKLFEMRKEEKSEVNSSEKPADVFSPEVEALFQQNKIAWTNFLKFPPSQRRNYIRWIMSAKQQATIEKRLNQLMAECEAGNRLDLFSGKKDK